MHGRGGGLWLRDAAVCWALTQGTEDGRRADREEEEEKEEERTMWTP